MQQEPITSLPPLPPLAIRHGVLVLQGYGLRMGVHRKHLIVSDGFCDDRRELRLAKATAHLQHLIVLGHSGTISLEAIRWLHDIGAAIVQIDADGQVLLASGPASHSDGRLRRAQAFAALNGVGLNIVRYLLREKLLGQARALDDVSRDAAHHVRSVADRLHLAQSVESLRILEADGAARYFATWASMPVQFVRRAQSLVPRHWLTFGSRTSPLTHSPRLAINPAQACLGYLYAILETEGRIACQAMGLDGSMGLLHSDLPYRDSFVLDLIEAARPRVDAFLLNILRTQIFRRDDFVETRQGTCRLTPHVAHEMARLAPQCARMVAPTVEHVVQMLMAEQVTRKKPIPTRLSGANRSAGRDSLRRRARRQITHANLTLPRACHSCGVLLETNSRDLYCQTCRPEYRQEVDARFAAAGPQVLEQLRWGGVDPAHGGEAQQARKASLTRRQHEATEWEEEHVRPDPAVFKRDILPRLRRVTLTTMSKATGLGLAYCSMIRRGQYVPHPRHWAALSMLRCDE